MDMTVRAIAADDWASWLPMWNAYCAFYETDVPQRVTVATWQRIISPDHPIGGLIANSSAGEALGFAHYVIHPFTWSERPACYLEDLFVREDTRGHGTGHALIEQLSALAQERQWARIYWMTRETNAVARRLYDRFAQRDDFVRYELRIERLPQPS